MELEVGERWRTALREGPAFAYPPKQDSPATEAARHAVAQIKADHWFALAKWAKERGFLEGWERGLAFSLGKLASGGVKPSDKQVIQGARIVARAAELGFSPKT
jgi:hypothetical protein